ncbi:MAG: putative toxin-antitoxin system toxin component, PIN family [Ornithinimicrobium sp.]|uniref:putative toxin-antitoxin system toxin component, PIN family n=1 Tax=Ornithinimicrobium sp. TaxID=1977084 RepID=UPI003D9BD2C6
MATRAVADTNVLVAAAITARGVCGRLLTAAIDGRWTLVVSPLLAAELETVLGRDKFRSWLSHDDARRFVADVRILADVVPDPPATAHRVTADPDDEFLVALAAGADVVALVSGDPHLTEVVQLDPPVLTSADFLASLSP